MRKVYHAILKRHFRNHLIDTRNKAAMTQLEISEKLHMDERSYADLESGKVCCSAVTLVLYLVYICDDVQRYLEELRNAFDAENNQVA